MKHINTSQKINNIDHRSPNRSRPTNSYSHLQLWSACEPMWGLALECPCHYAINPPLCQCPLSAPAHHLGQAIDWCNLLVSGENVCLSVNGFCFKCLPSLQAVEPPCRLLSGTYNLFLPKNCNSRAFNMTLNSIKIEVHCHL